jgi:hypothetical protein
MHPDDVWPGGPNIVVRIDSLSMLTEIKMKISLTQLRTCAEGHLGFIKQRCNKADLLASMAKHVCEVSCPSTSIVVRPLKYARQPLLDQDNETRTPLSAKAKGKRRAVDTVPMQCQAASITESPITDATESPTTDATDVKFPSIASDAKKRQIIKEWQTLMDFDDLTRQTCAVCSQSIARRDTNYALAEEIDFTLLQNPQLPAITLPTSYNLQAYDHAILNPKGLHCLQTKGPICKGNPTTLR